VGCYRTILAAVDGSKDAQAALRHAAALARDLHARLVVLTVVPPPQYVGGIGAGATAVADLQGLMARELHRAVDALPDDIGVEARLVKGRAADRILEAADQCRCDLIVMGFRGHGRLRQAVRGSVADTVARNSERPVLLVRAECTPPSTSAVAASLSSARNSS
jgi:nucleotide-binding universal stress UspA family protein